jgi:imidazoleglycerol-phosphate dehydratase
MRAATIERVTNETAIRAELNIDGDRAITIDTGIGFFDHMLTAFAFHAHFDLTLKAQGDLHVDAHHTVEDTGIVLGQALKTALTGGKAITRYGNSYVAMDEALCRTVIDISGRRYTVCNLGTASGMIGAFDAQLTQEFFRAFADAAAITLHIDTIRGVNAHHIIEAIFKSVGRALKDAVAETGGSVPSTKGVL